MNINVLLVSIIIGMTLITMILYVLFGQVTVRKLRKNLKTKDILGVEFASGWDIINVAQARSIPKSWAQKLEGSSISFLYAKSDILLEHTTKFDRILGITFYITMYVTGIFIITVVLLDYSGVLD